MSARCYVCGSAELAADVDMRSPTCEECKPAREHVVSMQSEPGGGSRAVCPCGWTSTVKGKRPYVIQDVKVHLHWNDVIARANAAARLPGAA